MSCKYFSYPHTVYPQQKLCILSNVWIGKVNRNFRVPEGHSPLLHKKQDPSSAFLHNETNTRESVGI